MKRISLIAALLILVAVPVLAQTSGPIQLRIATSREGPGGFTLITLASGAIINTRPGDLAGDRLNVTATEPTCVAAALVTTAAGIRVFVPLADIVEAQSIGQRSPTQCLTAWMRTFDPSLPSDATALSQIRAKCAADWAGDFRMRNYCEEQQLRALEELRRRR